MCFSKRLFQILKTVRFIRRISTPHKENSELYRLYISQQVDTSTLSVVEAFTEEAPQVGEAVRGLGKIVIFFVQGAPVQELRSVFYPLNLK